MKINLPKRRTFEDPLFGAYNIAPEPTVEPGSAHGRAVNSGALDAAKALYDLMERSPGSKVSKAKEAKAQQRLDELFNTRRWGRFANKHKLRLP